MSGPGEFVEGPLDPTPYKVERITDKGEFHALVAQYATEAEAMAHRRRLDWLYRVRARGKVLWSQRPEP